jgi:GNAT superfamily N-acetyltransferase
VPDLIVEELVLPARADVPEAVDFTRVVDLRNTAEVAAYGTEEVRRRPNELLPFWQDPQAPVRLFGIRVDGHLQAASFYETLLDDSEGCWITVLVDPDYRRRGLGTALANHAEALAASEGYSKLIGYAPSGTGDGERIESPTGFGSVPASNPEVRFLLARGYRLEQVERASRLALPIDVDVPEPAVGYRLHYWQDHTPEAWLEDMALMFTRMSTDAPSAGLDEPEDVYTVERVLEFEAAADASPRTQLVVAVEHIDSGRLAGFSELRVPPEPSRAVGQGDTLVLREHRGHRVGMLMKAANLQRLQRDWPGRPSVITHNAEENRFMLDVNEAIGFVPIGYEGAWRKDI